MQRLRWAGVAVWALVLLPVLLQGGLTSPRLLPWSLAHLVFLVAFVGSAGGRGPWWLLPVQTAAICVIVLLMCDGFEGALLVLVALEAGGRFSPRRAVAFVAISQLLLAVGIAIHWSPRPAVMLALPYLGFQLLALVLSRANAELRATRELVAENSRLAERVRIARELHDAVGHQLTALRLNLDVAARFAEGRAREPVTTAQALAERTLDDVRAVVAELRDAERIDLATALRAMAADIPKPRIHMNLPAPLVVSSPTQALTLLRCAQEIVTNSARHASAKNLWIDVIEERGTLELRARDDGVGSNTPPDRETFGGGLAGLRARLEGSGGHLEVASIEGGGFSVRATVPA